MKKILITGLSIFLLLIVSCKKAVEVNPPVTNLTTATVFANSKTAAAAVTAIYSQIIQTGTFAGSATSSSSFSVIAGLTGDELTLTPDALSSISWAEAYTNSFTSATSQPVLWSPLYNFIYATNAAINGINASNVVTEPLRSQLLGESEFLRAWFYFYLVNNYGDVPLVTGTAWQQNTQVSRTPAKQVYQQIIADLKDAANKLSTNFVDPNGATTTERVRPNKWAAFALLARVYLYYGNLTNDQTSYTQADSLATAVISNSAMFSLVPLNNVFLKNSNEAIWQLQMQGTDGVDTPDGFTFILASGPNSYFNPVYLSPQLLNAFEPNDQRVTNWIGVYNSNGTNYYYPYKYKVTTISDPSQVTEYSMVLRLAEQYLIRAEAMANEGNTVGAASDLNTIRSRAGLPNTSATGKADLLASILHERQTELFTEWGHRWLDLKRTANVNAVMGVVTPQKGGTWKTSDQLFPIPLTDIQDDHNLTQNPGY